MYILSFTPNESGPAVDDGLRFLSGFILKQFPAGNKVLKEEMRAGLPDVPKPACRETDCRIPNRILNSLKESFIGCCKTWRGMRIKPFLNMGMEIECLINLDDGIPAWRMPGESVVRSRI
jgi:hypothetical protein